MSWRAVEAGALAGGVGALLALPLRPGHRAELAAVELGFVAGAYPAMALTGHSKKAIALESLVSGLFVGGAVAGLARRSRLAIAAGLLAHAGWDAVHHRRSVGAETPEWFPPFCMAADIVLAVLLARPSGIAGMADRSPAR